MAGSSQTVAQASSSSPQYQEGELVWLSVDLNGNLRVNSSAAPAPAPAPGTSTGALTDAELRAAPVPVQLPLGLASEDTLTLVREALDLIRIRTDSLDVPLSSRTKPTDVQSISGSVAISNFPSSQAVTGAFYPATQPVSLASQPLPTGASTEATLAAIKARTDNLDVALSTRAGAFPAIQPVSGTVGINNFPATQPISGSVGVNNFPATQPVSGTVGVNNFPATQPISGTVAHLPATLVQSQKSGSGVALTVSLPVVAGQFHYISRINIIAYAAAARTGVATPVDVTTTNLPGSLAWTTPTAAAIGTQYETDIQLTSPLKSTAVATATTIAAPATSGVIWRINVFYYTAP